MSLSHYVPRTRPLAVGGGSTGGKNIGPSPREMHHGADELPGVNFGPPGVNFDVNFGCQGLILTVRG